MNEGIIPQTEVGELPLTAMSEVPPTGAPHRERKRFRYSGLIVPFEASINFGR